MRLVRECYRMLYSQNSAYVKIPAVKNYRIIQLIYVKKTKKVSGVVLIKGISSCLLKHMAKGHILIFRKHAVYSSFTIVAGFVAMTTQD